MKQEIVKAVLRGATVVYLTDESVNVYPSQRDEGRVRNLTASRKGRLSVDSDGGSRFVPFRQDSGSRYTTLFRTAHGEVKETRRNVIFQLRFPKRMGKALIEALHRDETEEQAAFIKTRRTETQW